MGSKVLGAKSVTMGMGITLMDYVSALNLISLATVSHELSKFKNLKICECSNTENPNSFGPYYMVRKINFAELL